MPIFHVVWVTKFAEHFMCPVSFEENTIKNAKNLLQKEFDNNSVQVCLMISTTDEIKVFESHKVPLEQLARERILERKKYEKMLQTHLDLKFMEYGTAGRIRFDVVPSENEEGQDIIRFKDLERAPIIDIKRRMFRRSFPLSVDYKLLENTRLFGNSTKEELLLFANRHLFGDGINPTKAVVSLLNRNYGATAFRVSPLGGLITCYHNLSSEDHGLPEDLFIHKSVVSKSYEFAGSHRESVKFEHCELPILEESAKDPLDDKCCLAVSLTHSDIAFLRSSPEKDFLIPCATDLDLKKKINENAVVCIGYPRKISSKMIEQAYYDLMPVQAPDQEEYGKLFEYGNLSISPGPLIASNSSALACEVATTPGYSGSPVCLLENPRMFIGIHYRARHGKDYALSISVKDAGFYRLYSELVVPELRKAELLQEDIDEINKYLSIGDTEPIVSR